MLLENIAIKFHPPLILAIWSSICLILSISTPSEGQSYNQIGTVS